MSATIDPTALGMPVELGQIGRELKKLWERDSGVSTRASLINFAVYCEGAEAMAANTQMLMEFTREHACRAILIGLENQSAPPQIRAWINAHCHLSRAGAKQVCCEQISFLFEGDTKSRIPSILFSNLDSDLPLYLWWQGEFSDPIDEQLWAWVDRLIFDSQAWGEPRRQFSLLKDSLESSKSRLTLCDLNWTRTLHMRQAIAQMFDHPENLAVLEAMDAVTIVHAPGFHSTAMLLVGWLVAQLKLQFVRAEAGQFVFANHQGGEVRFSLRVEPGRSIASCSLSSPVGSLQFQRESNADFFRVEVRLGADRVYRHLVPGGNNASTTLLLEEIGGGGQHRIYLAALAVSEKLL